MNEREILNAVVAKTGSNITMRVITPSFFAFMKYLSVHVLSAKVFWCTVNLGKHAVKLFNSPSTIVSFYFLK